MDGHLQGRAKCSTRKRLLTQDLTSWPEVQDALQQTPLIELLICVLDADDTFYTFSVSISIYGQLVCD